jgi:DNA-binding MarR family transcriptional regulator
MELEKEIASTNFENNHHKTVVNVIYTYGWVTNLLRRCFDKHDITMQQFNILRILRGQYPQPATVSLLKERMLDKMSDASRIVDRLLQKELISRCTNLNDRRAVDITINTKGLSLLAILDQEMNVNEILKSHISDEEADQLNVLLDKMRG